MTKCIVCGSERVEPFLDLGKTSLANRFLTKDQLSEPEPLYPLCTGFCHSCTHVQLMDAVPPQDMFEDYLYVSAASDTLKAHLYSLSDVIAERYSLSENDRVMDIGCNDATLLRGFQRHGVNVLGVDPAQNLAELTSDSGISRYTGFFGEESAREILERWGEMNVITFTNTFPHIPNLSGFLHGLDTVLAPDGVIVLEAHYLGDLIAECAFDTIYHEHISYWALGPMKRLYESMGMEIIDVEHLPIHHGQLRVFIQRKDVSEVKDSVKQLLDEEVQKGLREFSTYQCFAGKAMKLRADLCALLDRLKEQGKHIAGYGAPAKGNTLLSFAGIGPERIDFIADRSSLKQGRYTPGTHIPVSSPDRILTEMPDYLLLLAWNFAEEVMRQQEAYRQKGGQFIIPVPEVRIV